MKPQQWIFSVRHYYGDHPTLADRHAVVGPASPSTVEAALHLAKLPEEVRAKIRAYPLVRAFIDGKLDPAQGYYYPEAKDILELAPNETLLPLAICIGLVHEVLADHCPVCEGPHQDTLHRQRRAKGR